MENTDIGKNKAFTTKVPFSERCDCV